MKDKISNTILIFSGRKDPKSLFLSANAYTPYYLSLPDFTDGPLVVETPPDALDTIDDMWFNWVVDFGFPGPVRVAGGKFLLVPPGYAGELPDEGFYIRHVNTYQAVFLGRSFMKDSEPKPTVDLIKKTTKYTLI